MFRTITLCLAATSLASFLHADEPDPKELLSAAVDAVEANDSAIYHVTMERPSTDGSLRLIAEADVWLDSNRYTRMQDGVSAKSPSLFYVEGIGYEPDGRHTIVRAASDGYAMRVLDPDRRIVWHAHGPETGAHTNSRPVVRRLAQNALINPTLLRKLAGQDMGEGEVVISYQGKETIDGVICHHVVADWVRDLTELWGEEAVADLPEADRIHHDVMEYWIGADDHLPRRWIIAAATRLTVSRLRTNVPISRDIFMFEPPLGFEIRYYGWEQMREEKLAGKAIEVNERAPDWTLQDSDGVEHSLSDYLGKIVLLDFWGTWCLPCKRAMPHLQAMHERFGDQGVVIMGLSCSERDGRAPVQYMRDREYTYLSLLEGDTVADSYGVAGYPTVIVLDRDGSVLFQGSGTDASKEAEPIIERLLEDDDRRGGHGAGT